MKKILSILTTGILTISSIINLTAFTNINKIQNNDNYFNKFKNQQNQTWQNTNLNDFIVPYHQLNIQNNHAVIPSSTDININIDQRTRRKQFLENLGNYIDKKYSKFIENYALNPHLFYNQTSQNPILPNDDFNIIDLTTNLTWVFFPVTLNVGHWISFNLQFVNLLNNSSFNFSINITNFDLKEYSSKKSINIKATLPSMDLFQKVWDQGHPWYFYSHVTNKSDVVMDFKNIQASNGDQIGIFENNNQAGFFLKPLQYTYNFNTYMHFLNDDPYMPIKFTATTSINLYDLKTTNINDLLHLRDSSDNSRTAYTPIDTPYIKNYYKGHYAYSLDPNYDMNDHDFRNIQSWEGSSSGGGDVSDSVDVEYYLNENHPTQLYLVNVSAAGSDAIGGYYFTYYFKTYGTSLTTSYNSVIFDNTPYNIPSNFNPTENIISNISSTNINLAPFITDPSLQDNKNNILNSLNTSNNNILKTYSSDNYSNWSLSLASGSNNLVKGLNPGVLTLILGSWNSSINISIWFKEDAKETFINLTNILDKAFKLDPEFEYIGSGFIDWDTANCHIDTTNPKTMSELINGLGTAMGNKSIWSQDKNFNNDYSQYISFDPNSNIKENTHVKMHINIANFTKDYNVSIWWRSMMRLS